MSTHRFSAWDGTQDPLGPDVEEIFNRLSEDVFHGWDFETALRRMLSQGWRDKSGRRLMGLEEMTERLARQRRKQLEKYSLNGVFDDITEKLDNVVRMERQGIDERVSTVEDESARRILDRVAAKRREQLDNLPRDPGGAIRELQGYEFMDERAEQAFQRLLEEIKKGVVDTYFKEMTEQMQSMSSEDVATLRAMAKDLNRLVREKLEGVPDAQRQRSYESFLEKWGRLFPNAPPKVDDFLDEITKQMARMDSLMRSLSPEMRSQLGDLMDATFGDPELQAELAELGAGLEMLSPRGGLGSRYSFFGGEQLPLDEAMNLMGRLQSMEELERSLREVYRGGQIPPDARSQLRDMLGDDAARSLDQLSQMARELEARGLVQRDADGLRLTARGMRRIGQKALGDLFAQLRKDRFGEHALPRRGQRGERADDSKPYEFGDPFDLDVERTVMNAIQRQASEAPARAGVPRLTPDDFEVHRSDALTRSSTVLMLDMSRSMPLRGYFYAAKKVALALDSLIRSQYPRDSLHIIGFSDIAREISSSDLPHLSVNEYVYGTNMQHGLMLARRMLARDSAANKQIIIVSDGEPTAHIDNGRPVFFYPPLPETFEKTLIEVQRCTREHIVINTFMLESNHQLVQFVDEMTRLNRGRAFFISPDRLGDYVLVDYVASKRRRAA
ncbi:MAG: VWA domain-containing protein [Candidatus Dormibacteraeota bacterium]|uniref:VWA domain-containing protein n=1 Tax=Candidatus Aeolococcus gillhamiae TaxID=3127015 RepID=A0A2W5ZA26_9BACT|nr:VWA domain-containing protein [Candidatus Dormibacteraeota bacterium]PZR82133.1 MAG: VWA domain-containing protein [Candidatus Dormibacter sp. RRmetagenome_bin12]